MRRIRLWDLPTRVFHWTLAGGVVAAFVSEKAGRLDWHATIGLTLLGLLVFRLAWGVIGGRYARFGQFVAGPGAIRDYLQGRWRGVGHNPLGALSVLAMLGLLAAQVATGLFANDDSTFFGPLQELVSREMSDRLTDLHRLLSWGILGLALLHVAAILFYRLRGDDLVRPMLTGWKDNAPDDARDSDGGGWLAFAVALLLAGAAVYAASGALLPPPPPPAALPPTPAW